MSKLTTWIFNAIVTAAALVVILSIGGFLGHAAHTLWSVARL